MTVKVVVLEAGGIQGYVFESNRLQDNVGGSDIVYRALRQWAFDALDRVVDGAHNIDLKLAEQDVPDCYRLDRRLNEGNPAVVAEVVYAGGGSLVLLFGGAVPDVLARRFIYQYSRQLRLQAPHLPLYAGLADYEWAGIGTSLPAAIDAARRMLAAQQSKDSGDSALLGLSVSAACAATGLPANGYDREPGGRLSAVNQQVLVRRTNVNETDQRLRDLFPSVTEQGFTWTRQFDQLAQLPGRNESYLAVVHADGNGMGQRIAELAAPFRKEPQARQPRAYIKAMRHFSIQVQMTARAALQETVADLLAHLRADGKGGQPLDYNADQGGRYFPFRPIIFGGDDVTWVCPGPWGISLAQRYLASLEAQTLPDGHPPYACAGVAIVKTHYPFARAYALANELAKSAKKRVAELHPLDHAASALDWHLSTTGLTGNLDQIRQREYEVPAGRLYARPYLLDAEADWRSWRTFSQLVTEFRDVWLTKRNKIFALREALREGPAAVRQFSTIYRDGATPAPAIPDLEHGWVGTTGTESAICALFDAVEAADQFIDLPTTGVGAAP